ncbi:CtrA inhibitor SciP [Acidimangrovimonas pyrenivorans]|uniref:DUF1153 domain-containing protein n=1 Tax=Acidimangrovimonas pyrenivorans TaxID=2030798 RepID=A0ABV7AF49_9RHOB
MSTVLTPDPQAPSQSASPSASETAPEQVKLSDGSVLRRADLPPPDTRRWVASRKAMVVRAVQHGLIGEAEALRRYALSEEEFTLWRRAVETHGEAALKVTAVQRYRQL